ncbi:hypothetical protein J4405_04805 [Candidatus Woesearchaeota archaeon]|nr:hypothetical protein [Candidatus Woesearchaeota archaeon]
MRYEFRMLAQGDLGLRIGEDEINMGYIYPETLPVYFWLVHMQKARERRDSDDNLMRRINQDLLIPMPLEDEERGELGYELNRDVENALELAARLPLSEQEFNFGTIYFDSFSNGIHSVFYQFSLKGERLRLEWNLKDEYKKKEGHNIPVGDIPELVETFLKFVREKEGIEGLQDRIIQICERLRKN